MSLCEWTWHVNRKAITKLGSGFSKLYFLLSLEGGSSP